MKRTLAQRKGISPNMRAQLVDKLKKGVLHDTSQIIGNGQEQNVPYRNNQDFSQTLGNISRQHQNSFLGEKSSILGVTTTGDNSTAEGGTARRSTSPAFNNSQFYQHTGDTSEHQTSTQLIMHRRRRTTAGVSHHNYKTSSRA